MNEACNALAATTNLLLLLWTIAVSLSTVAVLVFVMIQSRD